MAPGNPEPSKNVVYCTLSTISIGEGARAVKLLEEIISVFFPQKELILQRWGEWIRRDSNPHLRLGQSAVFPLHHGPGVQFP